LADLELKVELDRDGIYKHQIVSTVLERLNEKGEQSLRERREILKRVTEFEDFSTCWPNDQLAAQGLVAKIRQVVNVKDSFTRMKQEREREVEKRRAEYKRQMLELEQKQAEFASIKSDLFSLFRLSGTMREKQERGKLLESILNRMFRASEILIREAFELVGEPGEGIIAQIDGVIELDGYPYLVEMKWHTKRLGKAEVSPHLVDIFNRGHAGGILISASGFSTPAIKIFEEALTQKVVILCELEEIVALLERQDSLLDFLKQKRQAAAIDKRPLFRPYG
jgi:hypothetical protein